MQSICWNWSKLINLYHHPYLTAWWCGFGFGHGKREYLARGPEEQCRDANPGKSWGEHVCECQSPESKANIFQLQQDSNTLPNQRWSGFRTTTLKSFCSLKAQTWNPETFCGMILRSGNTGKIQMCQDDADFSKKSCYIFSYFWI